MLRWLLHVMVNDVTLQTLMHVRESTHFDYSTTSINNLSNKYHLLYEEATIHDVDNIARVQNYRETNNFTSWLHTDFPHAHRTQTDTKFQQFWPHSGVNKQQTRISTLYWSMFKTVLRFTMGQKVNCCTNAGFLCFSDQLTAKWVQCCGTKQGVESVTRTIFMSIHVGVKYRAEAVECLHCQCIVNTSKVKYWLFLMDQ